MNHNDYSSMTILITGGTGFVMSNVARYLLETNPSATVVILDLTPVEGLVADFFAPVSDRLIGVQGDIRDRDLLNGLGSRYAFTHVAHAAMVAGFPSWERESPATFIDVNVLGTVNVLEWARTVESLQQFLYVSSGGVYGEALPDSPTDPQPETGPFNPPELYAISKLTSERIVRRYGQLFDMVTPRVRLSGVFGQMERPTPGRVTMSMPYHMVRSVIEQRPFRTTARTLEAGGDFLSAEDIASAMSAVIQSTAPQHNVYNIAFGTFTMVPEALEAFEKAVPAFEYEVVDDEQADVIMDPEQRYARWNAYAIDRISGEFGWQPRPLVEEFASYYEWVMADPERRCPPLGEPHALDEQVA
jgi:nucleoside-diphosphate-sugar epimerase